MLGVCQNGACLAVAWLMVAGIGCERREARAIRDVTRQIDELTDGAKGEEAVALISPESFVYYDRLVKLAREAPAAQLRGLPATEKSEILTMRNRLTLKELEPLDGRGWIVLAINRGWWHDEESWDADRIRVSGPSATARAVIDGEPNEATLRFVRVEDRWLIDYRRRRRGGIHP